MAETGPIATLLARALNRLQSAGELQSAAAQDIYAVYAQLASQAQETPNDNAESPTQPARPE